MFKWLLCITFFSCYALGGQSPADWYQSGSGPGKQALMEADCEPHIQTEKEGKQLYSFPSRPLFVHTSADFNQWSEGKYLLEAMASVYAVDNDQFLVLDLKFNAINAKKTYGSLDQGARFRLYLANGESVYFENIEKDKGSISRQDQTSRYQAVLPLDKAGLRLLAKHYLLKIGIQWEKGYQEYEIQGLDLVQNQLNCLNEYR